MRHMNENILKDISEEISAEELSELEQMPPFKPSLRHRFAMRRIFAEYEKNNSRQAHAAPAPSSVEDGSRKITVKRLIIIFAAIACAALLTGAVTVYISKNFHGSVYSDNTRLFAVNTKNCPTVIEHEYYLSELPEGYELLDYDRDPMSVYKCYYDLSSKQIIIFTQYIKSEFEVHYNTEHHSFEEIEINGQYGLYLDLGDSECIHALAVWDNGEYILQIVGDLPKTDIINLAKSTKVLEN